MALRLSCKQKYDKTQVWPANFPLVHFHATVVAVNLALPCGGWISLCHYLGVGCSRQAHMDWVAAALVLWNSPEEHHRWCHHPVNISLVLPWGPWGLTKLMLQWAKRVLMLVLSRQALSSALGGEGEFIQVMYSLISSKWCSCLEDMFSASWDVPIWNHERCFVISYADFRSIYCWLQSAYTTVNSREKVHFAMSPSHWCTHAFLHFKGKQQQNVSWW